MAGVVTSRGKTLVVRVERVTGGRGGVTGDWGKEDTESDYNVPPLPHPPYCRPLSGVCEGTQGTCLVSLE